jgi:hypothetical protein
MKKHFYFITIGGKLCCSKKALLFPLDHLINILYNNFIDFVLATFFTKFYKFFFYFLKFFQFSCGKQIFNVLLSSLKNCELVFFFLFCDGFFGSKLRSGMGASVW